MSSSKQVDPDLPRLDTSPPDDPALPERSAVRRAFDAAAADYETHAVMQNEVCDRLLERLELTTVRPEVVLDLGAGTGRGAAALRRRCRGATVIPIDLSERMLEIARGRAGWFRRMSPVCADISRLPIAARSVDLVFSSLGMQWLADPGAAFREIRRVLKPQGLFLFTTFGPDTLTELRQAWAEADGYAHVNSFPDMHDIGDELVRSGLVEPVMDVEHFTLTYERVRDLMADLKRIGAHNVTTGRRRSLTGPGRMRRVTQAYEAFRQEGRLPATYEVVYGTAWAPIESQGAVVGTAGSVGVDELRSSLRRKKR